ncbi:MAG: ABC transporter permease [Anaerolineae bacterium]|nr:ABC transporter permease [Anaerolineae bacterium]MDW8298893.1 ABC transporter permease [Anaerolineae bacterium]
MDIGKVLLIIRLNVVRWFTDPTGLAFLLLAPFILTVIFGFAFSGAVNDVPLKDIPVVVVNQDRGAQFSNFGAQLEAFFTQPPDESLAKLIKAESLEDAAEARERVQRGKAAAAIIIPEDFSERLNAFSPTFGEQKITLEFYSDAASPISAPVVNAILREFLNRFTNVNIALSAAVAQNPLLLARAAEIAERVANAELPIALSVTQGAQARRVLFEPLQVFAPSMSVFFLGFAVAVGIVQIIMEKENGTLQRMLVSPTTRSTILAGLMGATYINGVLQLILLIIATGALGALMGSQSPVWGTDVPALLLVVLVVAAAFMGVGTLIVSLAKNRVQAQALSSAILVVFGVLGGAFFATGDASAPLGPVSYISPTFWGSNAFVQLTGGTFPALHIVVLLGIGIVTFGIGLRLFSQRVEV